MNLYFFTAADKNPVYRKEAEILIESGRLYGRDIHFFEIPEGESPFRYKPWIIGSEDLPEADRYIYLDSDSVLTGPGDWDAKKCQGVMDSLYFLEGKEKSKKTMSFIRCLTSSNRDGRGLYYLRRLWWGYKYPLWPNSGVVVLDADIRVKFCELWIEYIELLDRLSDKEHLPGDEPGLMFARQEFDLPLLPPKYNWLLKYQPKPDNPQLIHADGNVNGIKRLPYIDEVKKVLKK